MIICCIDNEHPGNDSFFLLEKTSERNILKRDKNVNVFPLGEERMEKLLVLSSYLR